MNQFLVFTIFAPVASWGDVAVGEVRNSLDRPTRSAALGMVGAALGISREDDDALMALETGYGVAVYAAAIGSGMRDFQTAQAAPASFVRRNSPRTRRQLLQSDDLSTIVSQRELRQESLHHVALWSYPHAPWSLAEIATAFRTPTFVLYAGRKANVLGLPVNALVSDAPTLAAALQQRVENMVQLKDFGQLRPVGGWNVEVHFDELPEARSGIPLDRIIHRRDTMASRARWQFATRAICVGRLPRSF